MKIINVTMNDFRGIRHLKLDFNEKTNIIIGINGAGKTAILDCIAILLSRLIGRIRSSTGTGRFFSEQDIKNECLETKNDIEIKLFNETINWSVSKTRRGRKKQTITSLDQLKSVVEYFHDNLENNEKTNLPLTVYYPVNRSVLDIPLRIRKKHPFDQLSAYDLALTGAPNSFRIFFEWFREREDIENENRVENMRYRDVQLESVRQAIYNFLPGFSEIKIKRSPLQMVVKKNEEILNINQLSDGEKCALALVGDLARRLAIANPSLEDPLKGTGIILIDEIDLHLHPEWQRAIIPALEKTFPNCQFILTTHSPQILSHVRPQSIWMLRQDGGEIFVENPEGSYGLDSNYILEVGMGVARRNPAIKDRIEKLFGFIENKEFKKARGELEMLRSEIGVDPELVKADVLIRRKERV